MAANHHSHPHLSNHELRRIAVAALVDPRTVVAYLQGDAQLETTRLRIEAALRSCDHERFVRAAAPASSG